MSKEAEKKYIETVAEVNNIHIEDFKAKLFKKPYHLPDVAIYLMDIAQVLGFLPPKPARILDLGVGSGWTSEIFARSGYEVVGLDISDQMIEIAQKKIAPGLKLTFHSFDYENPIPFGEFDAAVIYDSLHHADDEATVVEQVFRVLRPGGVFLLLEPGKDHSQTPESTSAMEKYGTTEKDMPFSYVRELLDRAGFLEVKQYLRLRQFSLQDLSEPLERYQQIQHFVGMIYNTTELELSSLIVAKK